MKEPLISVIVPVYKVENYLNRCVESIVAQTYNNLEIILVDDGSPDCCPDMCDAWEKRDNRIKVIHKKNGGLSDARNTGLQISTGELIGFVDSDDWVDINMYHYLYEAMKRDNSDIVACSVKMIWEDGTPSRMLTQNSDIILSQKDAMQALIEETWLKQPVWYKLYKKKVVKNILFPVGKYHEDAFWSYQVIGVAKKVSVIDYIGYYYLQRRESIMGESYSLKRLDAIEALENRQIYVEKNFPSLSTMSKYSLWMLCLFHGQKILQCISKKEDRKESLKYIKNILKRHKFSLIEINKLNLKEKIWIVFANNSLRVTCWLRNTIRIGL